MGAFPEPRISKSAVPVAVIAIAVSGTLWAGDNQWTPVGPEGGVVSALAADPRTPSTMYAATCAGIFKTDDGGANWRARTSGLPAIACIAGLATDPQNSGTVYAVSGNQVFKTTDGGERWSRLSALETTDAPVLAIAPGNPNTLYASDGLQLLRSTDGGVTWGQAALRAGPPMAVDPRNQDTLYAGGGSQIFKTTDGGASWGSASSGQIAKSPDGGVNWSPASLGLPTPPARGAGDSGVVALAIPPQASSVIYALISETFFDNQGWRSFLAASTDGAATWTLATHPNLSAANLTTIAPDPQDAGTLYLGTSNGVLETSDAGAHWNFANSGLRAVDVVSLAADTQTAGTLLAASDARTGIFKSTDGGTSWFSSNAGLPSAYFGLAPDVGVPVTISGLVADPQNPGTLYALAIQGGGQLFQSEDAGGSWAEIWADSAKTIQAARVGPLAIAQEEPNVMYTAFTTCNGSCDSRIGRSTDGGHTWTESQVALRGMGCCAVITAVAIDPQDPNVVYAGVGDDVGAEGALWKSTDGGVSWVSLLPHSYGIDAILIDTGNPGTVYVVQEGSLTKSTDGGQTWGPLDLGPERGAFSSLVMDPQDSATLYCVAYEYLINRYEVMRTTDAGASWGEVGPGLSGQIYSLALDPQDPTTLYARTSAGLFAITLDARGSRPVR